MATAQRLIDKAESVQKLRREVNDKDRQIRQLRSERDREANRSVQIYLFTLFLFTVILLSQGANE